MKTLLSATAALCLLAPAAFADCATSATAAKCTAAPAAASSDDDISELLVGSPLPEGEYQLLLNTEYFGLPPAGKGWMYYRVGNRAYRASPDTLEVLEDVTSMTNSAYAYY